MDVKETLTRWARAYTEPSLFYVPVKKDELRYATVTLSLIHISEPTRRS